MFPGEFVFHVSQLIFIAQMQQNFSTKLFFSSHDLTSKFKLRKKLNFKLSRRQYNLHIFRSIGCSPLITSVPSCICCNPLITIIYLPGKQNKY